jgi:hypothetical protein
MGKGFGFPATALQLEGWPMSRFPSSRFVVAALALAAGVYVTNPALAQNINNLLRIFGDNRQRAARQASVEWRRVPPAEMACIDQRLKYKGSSIEALVRRGVTPSAARLIELRSSCRDFVESLQMDIAPALGKDDAGLPTSTVPASNSKDADVTPPSQPDSTKNARVTPPSSAESDGRVAEEQVQEGILELKGGRTESGIMVWLSAAFLFALLALTALLGSVTYLFIRWRKTGQGTVAVPLLERNTEVAGNTLLEPTIESAGEVVRPLFDKMGERGTATSMGQDSAHRSNVQPTYGEVFREIVSTEVSESNTPDSNAVERQDGGRG